MKNSELRKNHVKPMTEIMIRQYRWWRNDVHMNKYDQTELRNIGHWLTSLRHNIYNRLSEREANLFDLMD